MIPVSDDPMMSLADLQAANINPEVAREALTQAQRRLEDALSTKTSHEQKAFALLATYTTLALALFTTFGVLTTSASHALAEAFWVTGIAYAFGALLSALALLPVPYGAMGSDPSAWLRRGIIDGGANALPASLAYEAFFHRERIDSSNRSNHAKARLLRAAVLIGIAALVVLCSWVWLVTT